MGGETRKTKDRKKNGLSFMVVVMVDAVGKVRQNI